MIFKSLHPHSKIWLYISSIPINNSYKDEISLLFKKFNDEWKSHGEKISGSLKFIGNNIVVIGANYLGGDMCGRSVDAQVRFVSLIDQELGLDLLNRNNLAFSILDKIKIFSFSEIENLIKEDKINRRTRFYNNYCSKNSDSLQLPFGDSPLGSRYFS